MNLKDLQMNWTIFGKKDPLWSILTDHSKRNNKWDLQDFFLSGDTEINNIFMVVQKINFPVTFGKALDFGCGVGRITQSLAKKFEICVGVDISPTMIENAKKMNKYGERCQYILNEFDNLSIFEDDSFDFIYSNIVLQHMEPQYSKKYIREFVRILKKDGLLIFQIPSIPTPKAFLLYNNEPEYHANIATIKDLNTASADTEIDIPVRVKNISKIAWPSLSDSLGLYYICLGNHWLDQSQNIIKNDDGRIALPKIIIPNEEIDLDLTVKTPNKPGKYYLEFDLVQEGVTWFKDKGSKTVIKPIEIVENKSKSDQNSENNNQNIENNNIDPIMEAWGVPKYEVLEIVRKNSGNLINIEIDHSMPGWEGYQYFITK
jgi:ubiquinone/menaquinone biosynthesis C-methylase UbiE